MHHCTQGDGLLGCGKECISDKDAYYFPGLIDSHDKLIEVAHIRSTSAQNTTDQMIPWFAAYRLPEEHTWMERVLLPGLFCSNKPLKRVEPLPLPFYPVNKTLTIHVCTLSGFPAAWHKQASSRIIFQLKKWFTSVFQTWLP